MEIATFEQEREFCKNGYSLVIGIDEAGRGPLAGPVVAAACVLKDQSFSNCDEEELYDKDPLWSFVRDSKKISEKKRDEVYDFVMEQFHTGVGIIHPETIDRVNILEATFLAMKSAITDLKKQITTEGNVILLIDGNQLIPNISLEQKVVTKGDSKVKSIAAASIIAKVTRDRMMCEYDQLFPQYGFAKHKGYGTKLHMEALRSYGATPIHRKSFAPVKRAMSHN